MPRTSKPPKQVVCPFVVCVDSREQAPFPFASIDGYDVIQTVTVGLPTGDYSIRGCENRVSIERKSVSDYYGSIGTDRERFEREMARLSKMEFAAVVIEGDWQELLIDRPDTIQMSARAASQTIYSWSVRYGVQFWPCMGRRHAELTTFHLLRHWWNQEQERRKSDTAWIQETIDSL